jgi:helicase
VLYCFDRDVNEAHDQAARAKRAIAALAYVSGQEISEIERLLARQASASPKTNRRTASF